MQFHIICFINLQSLPIQLLKSGENTVTLKAVTRSQTGHYQCEVSADAPLFHTETQGAHLLVAELPDSEPVMTVYGMPSPDSKRIVAFGETFKTSCVSGPSYPSVNFTWIVNGVRHPVSVPLRSEGRNFEIISFIYSQHTPVSETLVMDIHGNRRKRGRN